jgi:hypothetical protein
MARPYILLTPDDGGLWRLAQAVARQSATEPLDFAGLAQRLCAKEAGEAEVNVAQMSEILADLRQLVAADPKAVLDVLAGKIADGG